VADSSFDVVSKVDRQEVDNALNQAAKELATRFDFRGTDTSIAWQGEETITITSSTEERAKAAVDVFKEKLIRRDISMKAFDAGDPQASGKTYKVSGTIKQGISSESAMMVCRASSVHTHPDHPMADAPHGFRSAIGARPRYSSSVNENIEPTRVGSFATVQRSARSRQPSIWISSLTTILPSRIMLKLSPKSFLLILVVAP